MESPQKNAANNTHEPDIQRIEGRPTAAPQTQEETDRQARIAYLKSLAPSSPPPRRRRKKIVLITITVLLVLAGAGAAFILMTGETPRDGEMQGSNMSKIQEEREQQEQQATKIEIKHHESPTFGLSFDYPGDWTVAEAGGRLSAVSPTMKLKSADGQMSNARIQMLIQPKQTTIKEFDKGNGLAMFDSEKITYTKPSPSQRGQTYLSFVNYSTSVAKGIDALYITGDIGYQKDQAVPMVDIVRVDPLITVSFVQCPNEACSGAVAPFTLDTGTWLSKTALPAAVKTVLTTLSIQ